MLHDNQIYGLTKKQASPTSPLGLRSNTTPRGSHPGGAAAAAGHAGRAERVVRGAGRRLDPGGALRHPARGLPPSRLLLRAHPAALPGMAAEAVRAVHPGPDEGVPAAPREGAGHQPRARRRSTATSSNTIRATWRRRAWSPAVLDPIPVGILYHEPRRALLRRPAARRAGALARARARRAGGGVRQVHHLAAGRRRPRPIEAPGRHIAMHVALQDQLAFHLTGRLLVRLADADRRARAVAGPARAVPRPRGAARTTFRWC